jgi:two-component system cell cycle sensor histidine kinase/response regulator CckA
MDGPSLVEKVRTLYPDLKVIFMSGYTEDKIGEQDAEHIHFLPKPFTLKQLAAKVKEVLEG